MSPSMWAWRVIFPGTGLLACSLVLWQSSRGEPSRATLVPRPSGTTEATGRVIAEGRLVARPGAEVVLGSESGGTVAAVSAREKAKVRKGDVLVEFRTDELRLSLAEAEARLLEADADVSYHQGEHLRKSQASTKAPQFQSELQSSLHDLQVSQARRKVADVAIGRARSALARAKITSPIDGVVTATYVEPGEIAAPGSRLVTVCDLSRLRIEAEVDEFDVARINPGDEVFLKAEGYDSSAWRGSSKKSPTG